MDLSPKAPSKPPTEAIYDGDVEAALVLADEVLTDVLAGELRPIAVIGDERSRDLPNVPTAKGLGHDVIVPVFGHRRARRYASRNRGRAGQGFPGDFCLAGIQSGSRWNREGTGAARLPRVLQLRRRAISAAVHVFPRRV